MLSFLNLQYFLAVTEEMNFNATAKKLHVTQQSLSGHIRKLEEYFGVKLFNYGPPLEITVAGLLLKKHAHIILTNAKELEDDMLEIKAAKSGTINFGCTYARAQFLLPPVIRTFREKYPFIKINMIEGNTPQIEELLHKNAVDIAIGYTPSNKKNITSIPLYKDPYLLVVHPSILSQSFPERKPIDFRCYSEEIILEIIQHCPFLTLTPNTTIGRIGREYLEHMNITPDTLLELKDVGTLLSMCYSQMGFMFCPQSLVRKSCYRFSQEHMIYPLPHQAPLLIAINYPSSKKQSSIIQAFTKILQDELVD